MLTCVTVLIYIFGKFHILLSTTVPFFTCVLVTGCGAERRPTCFPDVSSGSLCCLFGAITHPADASGLNISTSLLGSYQSIRGVLINIS